MGAPTAGTALGIALLFLGGCFGGAPLGERRSMAGDPAYASLDRGAILGTVFDEDGQPMESVKVGLLEAKATTSTDPAGQFVFANIAPGEYALGLQALGFVPETRMVHVSAGEVVELTFQLIEVPVKLDPVVRMQPTNGYLACSMNVYYPTNTCGTALENNDRFTVLIDPEMNLEQLVLEVDWEPSTTATGQYLEVDLCLPQERTPQAFHCAPDDLSDKFYRYASGPPPLRLVVLAREMPLAEHLTYEAWVGGGFASPYPTLEQPFTVYISACYEAQCPRDYTAIEPKPNG